jgi:hypothetical protein
MKPFKITKTIRFKLETKNENNFGDELIELNESFDLNNFVNILETFIDNLRKYLFVVREDQTISLKTKMVIKKDWLRLFAKQQWANYLEEQKNNQGNRTSREQLTIGKFKELGKILRESFSELENIYAELVKDTSSELNERSRRERTGLLLKRLQTRNVLPLLFSLIENTFDKNETSDVSIRLYKEKELLEKSLIRGIAMYLPAQSKGIPIAKASFNYYTINKNPIDYEEKVNNEFNKLKVINDINRIISLAIVRKKDKTIAREYKPPESIKNALKNDINNELQQKNSSCLLLGHLPSFIQPGYNYVSLRQILKNVKAMQKAKFNELMQKAVTNIESIINEPSLYLFHRISGEIFNDYKERTNKIQDLAIQLNQENISEEQKNNLRTQKDTVAKERGKILKDKIPDWKNYMLLYEIVAQKHGIILSKLKGIEKERTESQLLKYWSMIIETEGRHKLVLIPREKARVAYDWITKTKVINPANNSHSHTLYWFESLTYRSLQKLCFGYAGTDSNMFRKNINHLLKRFNIIGEYDFKGDEQKKIQFYKSVLEDNYTKQVLNLPFNQIQSEIINTHFQNLEEFQIALEKICYLRHKIFYSDIEAEFKDKFDAQIFTITSLDLTRNSGAIDKHHTQIWKAFWSKENEEKHFDIRLNPEISITYRLPKPSRVEKYGKGSKLYDPTKKNRYLYPQYTLITTLSENCLAPERNLSFMSDEEFTKSIDEFNSGINKDEIKFAIGIDNGEVELASLGIYLPEFMKETEKERIEILSKVNNYGFEVLTIKDLNYKEMDYNGKERKIIQNPSYFIKKELYMRVFNKTEDQYNNMFTNLLEKKHTLTLDLTTAKVIDGYIITNGDVSALFNLWMRHAQRNIYEMNDHIKEKTAKKIFLKEKLNDIEMRIFAEKISDKKELNKLTDSEAEKYIKWLFDDREKLTIDEEEYKKFKKCQCRKERSFYSAGIIYAISTLKDEIIDIADVFDIRNIFKKRKEFFSFKTEDEIITMLNQYNTNRRSDSISNEELDLNIRNIKESLVGNAIGVIDFLYKQYKELFKGEGIIVKEGFDTKKVEKGLEIFSGNIYRILERKLYQKYQNYGLVPPMKSLLSIRSEGIKDDNREAILQIGNIIFVSQAGTSQECPICQIGRLNHTTKCNNCNLNIEGIMHSNDGIAAYNIAKRGWNNFIG